MLLSFPFNGNDLQINPNQKRGETTNPKGHKHKICLIFNKKNLAIKTAFMFSHKKTKTIKTIMWQNEYVSGQK